MLSLTSLTAPLAALTAFSMIGVSCLQGPHQGAQKSTMTGTSIDASITSVMKASVVVSLMRLAALGALPMNCSTVFDPLYPESGTIDGGCCQEGQASSAWQPRGARKRAAQNCACMRTSHSYYPAHLGRHCRRPPDAGVAQG